MRCNTLMYSTSLLTMQVYFSKIRYWKNRKKFIQTNLVTLWVIYVDHKLSIDFEENKTTTVFFSKKKRCQNWIYHTEITLENSPVEYLRWYPDSSSMARKVLKKINAEPIFMSQEGSIWIIRLEDCYVIPTQKMVLSPALKNKL